MSNRRMKSMTLPGLSPTYKFCQEASDFSTSATYAKGDYCIYQGALFRFTTAHPAGAWNAAHVTEAKVAEDLAAFRAGTITNAQIDALFS